MSAAESRLLPVSAPQQSTAITRAPSCRQYASAFRPRTSATVCTTTEGKAPLTIVGSASGAERRIGDDKMRIVFEIVVVWVVLSCTLGPVLTWLFFYGERRARSQRALDERLARQHDGAELTGVRAA